MSWSMYLHWCELLEVNVKFSSIFRIIMVIIYEKINDYNNCFIVVNVFKNSEKQ